ncbi:MAG: hypothetical protein HFH30_06670 [Eubacterium sp.]|nr:hypothetical protein [Eubacterium sp.]
MGDSGKLFDGGKFCSWCHCPIPEDSENDLCKNCQASMEFREIRDYVREHDVNEFQLAEIFEIPLRQVKQWIREGRLEYKELQNTMAGLHCQRCGKAIAFGNFCPECNRAEYGVQGGFETLKDDADEQIRFYKKNRK